MKSKILIVDDNKDLLPLFGRLGDDKLTFLVAADGLEALAVIEENPDIAAVLLDLSMPTFDGIACVEEIRRNELMHPQKTPLKIAFFTASTIDSVIHRVQLKNNVERVFAKPIDPYQLIQQIKLWLRL